MLLVRSNPADDSFAFGGPMKSALQISLLIVFITAGVLLPVGATAMSVSSELRFPGVVAQIRPLKPGFPPRPLVPGKSSPTTPTTIRYSQSARAGNMVLPAILLGLPTIVIVALIIRSMRKD
jgi:hypothetical protein